MLAAAGGLRRVERQVGIADHAVGAALARIADGDSDRRADDHPVPFDDVGPRHLVDQGSGEAFEQPGLNRAGSTALNSSPPRRPTWP